MPRNKHALPVLRIYGSCLLPLKFRTTFVLQKLIYAFDGERDLALDTFKYPQYLQASPPLKLGSRASVWLCGQPQQDMGLPMNSHPARVGGSQDFVTGGQLEKSSSQPYTGRGSGGALLAPPAGSGAEPQPTTILVHFRPKRKHLVLYKNHLCNNFVITQNTISHVTFTIMQYNLLSLLL